MTKNEIIQQLTQTYQGSPYIITETKKGFDVDINVADMDWLTVFYQNKLSVKVKLFVQVDEAKKEYSVGQSINRMEWNGGVGTNGVPSFNASLSTFKGSVSMKRLELQGGLHKGGGAFKGYTLDTAEMVSPVVEVFEKNGYTRKMDSMTKVGVWFAIGGIIIALLAVAIPLLFMPR